MYILTLINLSSTVAQSESEEEELQHLCYENILSGQDQHVCQGEIIRVAFSKKGCCVDTPRAAGYMVPSNSTNTCFSCTDVEGKQ